jgi:hypothetical protein
MLFLLFSFSIFSNLFFLCPLRFPVKNVFNLARNVAFLHSWHFFLIFLVHVAQKICKIYGLLLWEIINRFILSASDVIIFPTRKTVFVFCGERELTHFNCSETSFHSLTSQSKFFFGIILGNSQNFKFGTSILCTL